MDNSRENGNGPTIVDGRAGEEVRRVREAAGMTQGDVVRELSRLNVEMSVSTLSRSEAGAREFKSSELQAIKEILETRNVGVGLSHVPDPPGREAPLHQAREILRRPALIFGIAAVLIGALGLAGMVVAMNRTGSTSPVDTRAVAAASCDHYRVAARDLWLRDQYGETVEQLPHDTDVVYAGKQNSAGHWEITTADGRHGWVDSAYLKPHC